MAPQMCHVYRPEKPRLVADILRDRAQAHYIARGLGRSYGDTAVNAAGGVIDFSRLNRMLRFDPETGILECEAGVSLAEIIETFLPRGFFLPVTPGTKFVTVGGAIANDVHGKNHHRDGTFGRFVLECSLCTPDGRVFTCSPEQNADLFWATVGGIGLTGVISTARVRLQRVESAYIVVDYYKSRDLEDALATMEATDSQYQYSVAWVDCLARGKSLGRCVLMRGNHAAPSQLCGRTAGAPFAIPARRKSNVPVDCPGFLLNPVNIRAFNTLFYSIHRSVAGQIIDYDRYFYPLDRIHKLEPPLRQVRVRPVSGNPAAGRREGTCRPAGTAQRREPRVLLRGTEAVRRREPWSVVAPDEGLHPYARYSEPGRPDPVSAQS